MARRRRRRRSRRSNHLQPFRRQLGVTALLVDVALRFGAKAICAAAVAANFGSGQFIGDGSIMLTATRSLTATISGTGTVLYGGNPPRVTRTVTGSGTISAG